jgi:hypothetical protein
MPESKSTFASHSLTEHLLRGAMGVALLTFAVQVAHSAPWISLALGLLMLVAFRGCPICWSIGLIETIHRKLAAQR